MKTPGSSVFHGAVPVGARPRNLELLADLFHALNQPLAALRCSLELSLMQEKTVEQYRQMVQTALEHTESVSHLIASIAQLLQADDGDGQQALGLDQSVCDAVEHWSPVADEAGKKFSLNCRCPAAVQFAPRRLQEALFHLLEFALLSSPPGGIIEIETHQRDEGVELALDFPLRGPGPNLGLRLKFEMAQRIFEAAGGDCQVEKVSARQRVRVRLPKTA